MPGTTNDSTFEKGVLILLWLGVHANILVITGILCGSLFIQTAWGEYPCPLCMVQRISMMLCALGQIYILSRFSIENRFDWKDFATGHALTLFAALGGLAMSARQILLHIVPPDPGYGSAILGLHLYTWGLLVFLAEILAAAINLSIAPRAMNTTNITDRRLTRFVLICFASVVFVMTTATFIEEGFHWVLPDDPVQNQLLIDLGIQ